MGQLGTHGQPQTVAQLGGLTPADVAQRRGAFPERGQLIPGAAGIVGNDRVFFVHDVVQLPHYPVRTDGGLIISEFRHPLTQPFLFNRRNAFRYFSAGIGPSSRLFGQGLIQGIKRQLRIPQERIPGWYIFVEIHRVERGMNDGFAGRHLDAKDRLRETAAHTENHVCFLQEVFHGSGIGQTARPQRQRVDLGKGAFAFNAGGHRNVPGFGEGSQLLPGFRIVHALARVDHRALGLRQYAGCLLHRRRIGPAARGEAG